MANIAQPNRDLRLEARGAGVPLWRIAQAIGITEGGLIKRWRKELSEDDKNKIRAIIAEIRESA